MRARVHTRTQVIYFMRDIVEGNTQLRLGVLERLRDTFTTIRSARVAACALWILGEYSASAEDIRSAMVVIRAGLGPLPLATEPGEDGAAGTGPAAPSGAAVAAAAPAASVSKRPAVLADGTYATQSAVETATAAALAPATPNVRALLLGGDFFLGGVLSSTLVKLALRLKALGAPPAAANKAAAEAMLAIVAILRLGERGGTPTPMDDDSRDRMAACLKVLAKPSPETLKARGGAMLRGAARPAQLPLPLAVEPLCAPLPAALPANASRC
jgi:coatomer subunit beta